MRVLHAGCGGEKLPLGYFPGAGEIDEVRLDIDARHKPHVVAPLHAMGDIGEFDAVFTNHCLEHLPPQLVPQALAEFMRVLKPGGYALIVVPDLEGLTVSDEVLYTINGLEVTSFDLFYGHRKLAAENIFMAHRCGFTAKILGDLMRDADFADVTMKRAGDYNLIGAGVKRG